MGRYFSNRGSLHSRSRTAGKVVQYGKRGVVRRSAPGFLRSIALSGWDAVLHGGIRGLAEWSYEVGYYGLGKDRKR